MTASKEWRRDYMRRWRDKNPEKVRALAKANHHKKQYGITPKQYGEMVSAQKGRCAICGVAAETLCVDHCHATGKIRGLLCRTCNWGIGHLKDSVELLKSAVAYLES